MGRKNVQVMRLWMKRKFGLMNETYELSILCECKMVLIIFNSTSKLLQYASTNTDKWLLKYTEHEKGYSGCSNGSFCLLCEYILLVVVSWPHLW
uniref:MADS-box domain-containing protein n=1 Tax=Salvator merianae TaxID=96440 RepID=A0A8D0E5F6_SALMN